MRKSFFYCPTFFDLSTDCLDEKSSFFFLPSPFFLLLSSFCFPFSGTGGLVKEEMSRLFADLNLPCNDREIEECMMRLKTFVDTSMDNGDDDSSGSGGGGKQLTVDDMVQSMRRHSLLQEEEEDHHLSQGGGYPCSQPVTLLEFYNLWRMTRDDGSNEVSKITNRLCELRKRLGEDRSIFFGFNFDDWQSANNLDRSAVTSWSTRDVAKWFAFENDLGPLRKYLNRASLRELDGESLLEVNPLYVSSFFFTHTLSHNLYVVTLDI